MRRMYSKPQLLEAVEEESKLNGIKVFEDIKDKDGRPRFIEGDIDLSSETPTEIIKKYGKWSLSGTHLQIVLVIASTGAYNLSSLTIAQVGVPQWVKDKIVTIQGNNVARFDGAWWDSEELSFQEGLAYIQKPANNVISLYVGGVNLTSAKTFRVAFDLLIDNE